MSKDRTRDLPDRRSFEERVFARFDRIDTRFDRVEGRFDGLDSRVQSLEARALDTKPIWERALAEILEVKQGVVEVKDRVENVERSDAQHFTSDGIKEPALGEFAPKANVVRRKRKYPSRMGYAPRQLDVYLLHDRRR